MSASSQADIAVIVGSLRKGSFNRLIAQALQKLAPSSLKLEIVEIGQLPLYNSDLEELDRPQSWTDFRERTRRADGVIFVTPEYNRSVPAALKNAIDVGSRPYGQSVWQTKPAAVISSSPGHIGGFGANHHLRQSLVFLDMPVLQQPEAYIGGVDKLFDKQGNLTNPNSQEFLTKLLTAYDTWLTKTRP